MRLFIEGRTSAGDLLQVVVPYLRDRTL